MLLYARALQLSPSDSISRDQGRSPGDTVVRMGALIMEGTGSVEVGVLGPPARHYIGKCPLGDAGARPGTGGMGCDSCLCAMHGMHHPYSQAGVPVPPRHRSEHPRWMARRKPVAAVNAPLTVGFCHACVQNELTRSQVWSKRDHSSTQGPTVTSTVTVAASRYQIRPVRQGPRLGTWRPSVYG